VHVVDDVVDDDVDAARVVVVVDDATAANAHANADVDDACSYALASA
jgi:hypothetical protein